MEDYGASRRTQVTGGVECEITRCARFITTMENFLHNLIAQLCMKKVSEFMFEAARLSEREIWSREKP